MNPLISIIVPNYNHASFLKQRLDSIFNQTFQNFEVILLDDCSTDASVEILKEYAKNPKTSHCIFNETNSSNTFKQWAKGIALAKGEYIWIAESDDICVVTLLEKLLLPLQKDSDVVLAYCQSNRINERGEKIGNWITHTDDLDATLFLNDFTMDGNEFIERFLIFKNVIPNASAVVFRKNAVDIKLHFELNPLFKYCGDWMFYFKLTVNKKNAFVSESLNNFRYHSQSVIAGALQTEKRVSIIDIDFKMRQNLIDFLRKQKITNFKAIVRNNTKIKKELNYEKAFYYIRNNKKLKGYLLLISILDVFYKNYQIKKNLKIKFLKFFKAIYK